MQALAGLVTCGHVPALTHGSQHVLADLQNDVCGILPSVAF